MAEPIEAKESNIGNLFSPSFLFEIPLYQRPLSWGKENYEQLFDDIASASKVADQQYFLGSIILQASKTKKNLFEVVDGQQRLTAIAILMAVIRDMTNNESLKKSLSTSLFQEEDGYKGIPRQVRITPWEEMKDTFDQYIYKRGCVLEFKNQVVSEKIKCVDDSDPLYHLFEAICVFEARFRGVLADPASLDAFVKFLMGSVYLVYIKTGEFNSAFRMFTILNTRGVSLTIADLLKSENLGAIADATVRNNAAKTWQKLEESLGREALELLVIFIHSMKVKERARVSIYSEYQSNIFGKNLLARGAEFFTYISAIAAVYEEKVLDPEVRTSAAVRNRFKTIMGLLTRYVPFDDWIPCVLAFHHKFKADDGLCVFIDQLEKKVVIEWALGFSLTERITSLNQTMKSIDSKMTWQEAVSGTLNWSEPGKRRDLFQRKLCDSQFYSLSGGKLARYLLLRLDMEQWEMENFGGYHGSVTLEHVLPQTPGDDGEWTKVFDDASRKKMTNILGNLVLLSGRKNSKAQNYDFAKKKDAYFRGKSTAFRITRELESIRAWTPETLEERQADLAKRIDAIFFHA